MAVPGEEPLRKRPKVDNSAQTVNLLYFGLSFIWEEVLVNEPRHRIGLNG